MAHKNIFRNRTIQRVRCAMELLKHADDLSHPVLKGTSCEAIVRKELIEPLLIGALRVGTGIIVDNEGNQSGQCDAVIYAPSLLPAIFWEEANEGVFPADCVFAAVEVKKKLSKKELAASIQFGRKVQKLKYSFRRRSGDKTQEMKVPMIKRALFAFETSYKGDPLDGKGEFKAYKASDRGWDTAPPALDAFCIAARGCWVNLPSKAESSVCWALIEADDNFAEVLSFLEALVDDQGDFVTNRPPVSIGRYIQSGFMERAKWLHGERALLGKTR